MPFEDRLGLVEIGRLRALLRERDIQIVVNENEQACIAGACRLGTRPASCADTNSLCMVNSPMPVNTPGKVRRTRRMWSAAYMSVGLKPVIIGSRRACCCGDSALYAVAIDASVNE